MRIIDDQSATIRELQAKVSLLREQIATRRPQGGRPLTDDHRVKRSSCSGVVLLVPLQVQLSSYSSPAIRLGREHQFIRATDGIVNVIIRLYGDQPCRETEWHAGRIGIFTGLPDHVLKPFEAYPSLLQAAIWHEEQELLPADPAEQIEGSKGADDLAAERHENFVAMVVPVLIIDLLEMVEIEDNEGVCAEFDLVPLQDQPFCEPFHDIAPVRHTCQRIRPGSPPGNIEFQPKGTAFAAQQADVRGMQQHRAMRGDGLGDPV